MNFSPNNYFESLPESCLFYLFTFTDFPSFLKWRSTSIIHYSIASSCTSVWRYFADTLQLPSDPSSTSSAEYIFKRNGKRNHRWKTQTYHREMIHKISGHVRSDVFDNIKIRRNNLFCNYFVMHVNDEFFSTDFRYGRCTTKKLHFLPFPKIRKLPFAGDAKGKVLSPPYGNSSIDNMSFSPTERHTRSEINWKRSMKVLSLTHCRVMKAVMLEEGMIRYKERGCEAIGELNKVKCCGNDRDNISTELVSVVYECVKLPKPDRSEMDSMRLYQIAPISIVSYGIESGKTSAHTNICVVIEERDKICCIDALLFERFDDKSFGGIQGMREGRLGVYNNEGKSLDDNKSLKVQTNDGKQYIGLVAVATSGGFIYCTSPPDVLRPLNMNGAHKLIDDTKNDDWCSRSNSNDVYESIEEEIDAFWSCHPLLNEREWVGDTNKIEAKMIALEANNGIQICKVGKIGIVNERADVEYLKIFRGVPWKEENEDTQQNVLWILAGSVTLGIRIFKYNWVGYASQWEVMYEIRGSYNIFTANTFTGILGLCTLTDASTFFFSIKTLFNCNDDKYSAVVERLEADSNIISSSMREFPLIGRVECRVSSKPNFLVMLQHNKWAVVLRKSIRLLEVEHQDSNKQCITFKRLSVLNGHEFGIYGCEYDGMRRLLSIDVSELLIVWDTKKHCKLLGVYLVVSSLTTNYPMLSASNDSVTKSNSCKRSNRRQKHGLSCKSRIETTGRDTSKTEGRRRTAFDMDTDNTCSFVPCFLNTSTRTYADERCGEDGVMERDQWNAYMRGEEDTDDAASTVSWNVATSSGFESGEYSELNRTETELFSKRDCIMNEMRSVENEGMIEEGVHEGSISNKSIEEPIEMEMQISINSPTTSCGRTRRHKEPPKSVLNELPLSVDDVTAFPPLIEGHQHKTDEENTARWRKFREAASPSSSSDGTSAATTPYSPSFNKRYLEHYQHALNNYQKYAQQDWDSISTMFLDELGGISLDEFYVQQVTAMQQLNLSPVKPNSSKSESTLSPDTHKPKSDAPRKPRMQGLLVYMPNTASAGTRNDKKKQILALHISSNCLAVLYKRHQTWQVWSFDEF